MSRTAFLVFSLLPTALVASSCSLVVDFDRTKIDADGGMDAEVDAGCTSNAQCDDSDFCNGEEVCNAGTCESPGDPCTGMTYDAGTGAVDGGASLVCDEDMNACVGCNENADCEAQVPTMPICEDSMCVECIENADCTDKVCNTTTHRCVDCLMDADCNDSNECTVDSCNVSTNQCNPADTATNNGNACNSAAGMCLDGTCCEGCISGGTTCADPVTGSACGTAGGACVDCTGNMSGDACVASGTCGCQDAGDCDDGNECTTNTCGTPGGTCTYPDLDGNACTGGFCIDDSCCTTCETGGGACHADGLQAASCGAGGIACVDCSVLANTPLCATDGSMCVQCNVNGDCAGNPAGPDCNTDTCGCDIMADCSTSTQGIQCVAGGTCGCNDDSDCTQDATLNACPGADSECVDCTNTTHCAAGQACIAEACNASCMGTDANCDDGDPCTIDICNGGNTCEHAVLSDVITLVSFGTGTTDADVTLTNKTNDGDASAANLTLDGYRLCVNDGADCTTLTTGAIADGASTVETIDDDLLVAGGELALVPGASLTVCDYLRWDQNGADIANTLVDEAVAEGEWPGTGATDDVDSAAGTLRLSIVGTAATAANDTVASWTVEDDDPCTVDTCNPATPECDHIDLMGFLTEVDFGNDQATLANGHATLDADLTTFRLCVDNGTNCTAVGGMVTAAGGALVAGEDSIDGVTGELALMPPAADVTVCDYVRWDDNGAGLLTAILDQATTGAAAQGEWVSAGTEYVDVAAGTVIETTVVGTNNDASDWRLVCTDTSDCNATEGCDTAVCTACDADADCNDGDVGTTDYCNTTPPSECVHAAGSLIFVTAAAWNPVETLGDPTHGIDDADDACNNDTARPGTGGLTFAALVVDGTNRVACTTANCGGADTPVDWVLAANTTYLRAIDEATIGTTNAEGVFAALTTGFSAGTEFAWTGLATDWTTAADHCTNWTDDTAGSNGAAGDIDQTDSTSINDGSVDACNVGTNLLICVQQ